MTQNLKQIKNDFVPLSNMLQKHICIEVTSIYMLESLVKFPFCEMFPAQWTESD